MVRMIMIVGDEDFVVVDGKNDNDCLRRGFCYCVDDDDDDDNDDEDHND